jgi:hypothetical protein
MVLNNHGDLADLCSTAVKRDLLNQWEGRVSLFILLTGIVSANKDSLAYLCSSAVKNVMLK